MFITCRAVVAPVVLFLLLVAGQISAARGADEAKAWTPLGGLYEGNVGGFKEDAAGNLWVTTSGNGVFKSSDGGDTWTEVNEGLTCWAVTSIAISPKTGEIFVGTSGRGGGIFKLAKDGKTWQPFNKGLPKPWPDPTSYLVSGLGFNKAGDLFMGLFNNVISRLPAGSDTWQATGELKPMAWGNFVEAADGRMWTSGTLMLASTTDAGATWETATVPQVPKMPISQVMCITLDDSDGTIFAGGRLGKWGGSGGVFRSNDKGKTWTPSGLTGLQVNSIRVTGGKVFAGCRMETDFGTVYVSGDHGVTWTEVKKGLDNLWTVHGIFVNKHGLFVGANNGYRSTDGGVTFQKLNIPAVQYCGSIVVLDNGDIYTGGDMYGGFNAHGVSRLVHGTTTWKPLNQGLLSMDITTLIRNAKGELLAGDKYETTYRLVGNGDVWTKSNFKNRLGAQELVLAANGDVLAGTATSGSFISSDGGSTFVKSQMPGYQVNDFYIAPNGDVLAGVEGGTPPDWLVISKDNGKTYAIGLGKPPSAANSTWAIGPSPKGTVLLSTSGGIDEYLGDGKWRKAAGGLPGAIAARDFILNKAGTRVFAGTTDGVYFSTDGQTWQAFSAGLPPAAREVHSLAFDAQGYLYAGTVGGLFKTTAPQDK